MPSDRQQPPLRHAAVTLTLQQRGTFGFPGWLSDPKIDPFSDAAPSSNGTLPVTAVALGLGGAVESIRLQYNGTWAPRRGLGRAAEQTLTLAAGEFISEAYVMSDTTYKLFFGLHLRTNKGRSLGPGSPSDTTLTKAMPCPIGSYRLAFVSGFAGGTGMDVGFLLLNLVFYWAPVSAEGKQVAQVVYAQDRDWCDAPPPSPPPSPPPPPPFPVLQMHSRGPYGHPQWLADPAWSDAAAAQNGVAPLTAIIVRRGDVVESVQARYGQTWAPLRGSNTSGGSDVTSLVLDGVEEFITEVFLFHQEYFWGLQFRTNKGRTAGGGNLPAGSVQIGHPCPVGQFRLAYMSGHGLTTDGWGLPGPRTITFYWQRLADIPAASITHVDVELVQGEALCSAPASTAPAATAVGGNACQLLRPPCMHLLPCWAVRLPTLPRSGPPAAKHRRHRATAPGLLPQHVSEHIPAPPLFASQRASAPPTLAAGTTAAPTGSAQRRTASPPARWQPRIRAAQSLAVWTRRARPTSLQVAAAGGE
jgi:hypothetical protein